MKQANIIPEHRHSILLCILQALCAQMAVLAMPLLLPQLHLGYKPMT